METRTPPCAKAFLGVFFCCRTGTSIIAAWRQFAGLLRREALRNQNTPSHRLGVLWFGGDMGTRTQDLTDVNRAL